jgi:hypothetical protein
MRYALLMHYGEYDAETLGDDVLAQGQHDMSAYAETLHRAGVLISAEVLHSSAGTTSLSAVGGELRVQDGPFADTKEQLGGIFVLDVADLDAALSWASQAPQVAWGTVEIRPVATYTVDGAWAPNA